MKNYHMHKGRVALLCIIVLFLMSGCQNVIGADGHQSTSDFNYKTMVGWLQGPCLAIENDSIKPGSRLVLVLFRRKPVLRDAIVGSKTDANCPALNQDRAAINRQKGLTFYTVKTDDMDMNTVAIGILTNRNIKVINAVSPNAAQLDVNGDGQAEVVNNCTTSEGIKFFVWHEKAYKGIPLWEDYYYLGYDLKPTCPNTQN